MKITTKTTKAELQAVIVANAEAVKEQDKNLSEMIDYTMKTVESDASKVARKDLVDLAKDVIALLGDKLVVPALADTNTQEVAPKAEDSIKKLAKGVSKKQEIAETPADVEGETAETEEIVEEKAEKTAKKSKGAKKKASKKDGVIDLEPVSNSAKAVQLAKVFPKDIEVGDAKYTLAEDIKTLDDLYEALGRDEEIVFAYYWNKRHLKQFPYFGGFLGQPKSFDNDLDLATAIYVSDEKKVSYQVSMYTEAIYTILPTDFEEEDGVRIAGGIEFQIYRAVTTDEPQA